MELKLNTGILADALTQYANENGRGALAELHKRSGVHNLGRIARGEITSPTLDVWLQLYLSSREDIPPPTTVSGGRLVLVGEGEGEDTREHITGSRTNPIAGEDRLRTLYAKHRGPAVIKAITEYLERIDKAAARAIK